MSLPKRPATLAELAPLLAASASDKRASIPEFESEPSSNKDFASQCAALAAQGGAHDLGVNETDSGFETSPIDYAGVREHVGQIARDGLQPPVELDSRILYADEPGKGVMWEAFPPSTAHASPGWSHVLQARRCPDDAP